MRICTGSQFSCFSSKFRSLHLFRSLSEAVMYRCSLVSEADSSKTVALPHNIPVVLGRGPETGILDKRCSRKQAEFVSDCVKRRVKVKQLAINACTIDGKDLRRNSTQTLTADNVFHFLDGLHPHKVVFEKRNVKENSPMKSPVLTPQEKAKNKDNSAKESKKNITDFFTSKNKGLKRKMDDSVSDQGGVKQAKLDNGSASNAARGKPTEEGASGSKTGPDGKNANASNRASGHQGTPTEKAVWKWHDKLLIHTSVGVRASSKIASFDLDGNIITTESGRVFPTHPGDWRIIFAEVPSRLRKLTEDGYKIVFFTNQLGIQRGKVKVDDFKNKVENIITRLKVPVQVLVSTGPGLYRKPCTGMWDYLVEHENDDISIDKHSSFYVGDAAGRPVNWTPKRKKDFSCSDRLFALNLDLKFYTPEEYFLGYKKAQFNMPTFDPKTLSSQLMETPGAKLTSDKQEVVVMVGSPASGKSFFAKEHLVSAGYAAVNRDTLKTWQKCVEGCNRALDQGKSVVVDNTNPDMESRNRYIESAKKKGVPCRCFVLTTTMEHAKHNEAFREITDKTHEPIKDMVLNMYKSKYSEPKLAEGFTEVVKVNFVPKFKNESEEKLYRLFLKEK